MDKTKNDKEKTSLREITYLDKDKKICTLEIFPLEPKLSKESMEFINNLDIKKDEDIDEQKLKKFTELFSKAIETMINFVSVLDGFKRTSVTFSSVSFLHRKALKKRKYRKLYDKIKDFGTCCTYFPRGKPSPLELLAIRHYYWNEIHKS